MRRARRPRVAPRRSATPRVPLERVDDSPPRQVLFRLGPHHSEVEQVRERLAQLREGLGADVAVPLGESSR